MVWIESITTTSGFPLQVVTGASPKGIKKTEREENRPWSLAEISLEEEDRLGTGMGELDIYSKFPYTVLRTKSCCKTAFLLQQLYLTPG